MNKEQQLEVEYRKKQRQYEEREEELNSLRDRGLRDLEEVAQLTQYYLGDFSEDSAILRQELYKLEEMMEEVHHACNYEKMAINQAVEELEEDYRLQQRRLMDNEENEGEVLPCWKSC